MGTIYTIGFTRKTAKKFFTLLRTAGVTALVDIRLHNQSQLAGFSKRGDLAFFARELAGIEYLHLPELAPSQELFDGITKHGWTWEEYQAGFINLMEQRRAVELFDRRIPDESPCLLCSEASPQRCHRRLVAEALAARGPGLRVVHLE